MRIALFCLVILLVAASGLAAFASDSAVGEIRVRVINRPPEIKEVAFLQGQAYEDSTLECNVTFADESPETAAISYKWAINGLPAEGAGRTNSGFREDDNVTCEAVVTDREGLKSAPGVARITIEKTPVQAKALRPILRAAGIKASILEITTATDLAGVTGMATGADRGPGNGTSQKGMPMIPLLIIILMILTGLNLSLYLSKRKESSRSRQ